MDLGHDDGRGDTLSADVADAEEQLFVAQEEVVDITANLSCGHQRAGYLQVVAVGVGQEFLGQHAHLYLLSDAQFAAQPFLYDLGFVQFPFVACKAVDDESEHAEA